MAREGSPRPDRLRAAEVVGTLCLATDLGMGFPFEHGLQTTLIASRPAQYLDVDHETERRVYYGSLLAHAGCTTDAHVSAAIFGSSLVENLHPVIFGSRRGSGTLGAGCRELRSHGNATRCCVPCSSALGPPHRADRGDRAQVLDQHPVDGESALA